MAAEIIAHAKYPLTGKRPPGWVAAQWGRIAIQKLVTWMRMKEVRVYARWCRMSRSLVRKERGTRRAIKDWIATRTERKMCAGAENRELGSWPGECAPIPAGAPVFDDLKDSDGDTDSEVEALRCRYVSWPPDPEDLEKLCNSTPVFPAEREAKAKAEMAKAKIEKAEMAEG